MLNLKMLSFCLIPFSLIGCETTPQHKITDAVTSDSITGVVTYRERIALPANAMLIIKLQDTAKQDVAATTIAEKTIQLSTPPPWQFNLIFDQKALDTKGRYSLQARVEVDGELRFINVNHISAFAKDPISILVSSVGEQSHYNKAMLEVHAWTLASIEGKSVSSLDKNAETNQEAIKDIDLHFNQEKKTMNGFAGCNYFNGTYEATETALKFPPMMTTMMACPAGDIEMRYLKALSMVNGYQINGASLSMIDEQGEEILKYEIQSTK